MNTTDSLMPAPSGTNKQLTAKRFLALSAQIWFAIAFAGQWIFVYYVAAFYIPILRHKGFEGLADTHLPHGYVSGDLVGNLAISSHLILAIIVIGGGTLQLIPWIRKKYPVFHRYLGRTYVALAMTMSLAGLYLVWTRGVVGGMAGHLAISLDAILIIIFGIIAVRYAMLKKIHLHRRWALRLFMMVSAVWFFRIGLMAWFGLTGGVGIDRETFTGPFITFIYFGQMFVPLLFLELYLRAGDSSSVKFKYTVGIIIILAAGLTAFGVVVATMGMWLPRL